MRKLIAAFVVLGFMAVPAMADLSNVGQFTPSLAPSMSPTGEGTVGIYGYVSPYGPVLYNDFKTGTDGYLIQTIFPSDNIVVTFGFHWPYVTPVWAVQLQGGFVYDNSELTVLSMAGVGDFAGNNNFPGPTTWAGPSLNPTTGMIQVGSLAGTPLWNNAAFHSSTSTALGYVHYANNQMQILGSGIYPFAQIEFHVKDVIRDSAMDAFYNSFAILFWLTPSACGPGIGPGCGGVTYWTAGGIAVTHSYHTTASGVGYWGGSFGFGLIPEPASLSLLGLGLVSVGAGVWRRRRR